jgi:ElaB/YqjD/DUF883 family membrane-anchored ribosome-binding protein
MERDIRQEVESIRDMADRELRTMLRDVSSKAERHIRSADPGDIESLNLQQKVSGWIGRGVEDVIRDNIEPRLRELGDDVEQSIDEIRADIGALDVEAPRGNDAVGTALDVAVEGAMLVALNVVLPGEWVVAVIGRLLGSDLLEKLKGPVTRSIKQLFGRVSKSAIVNKTVDKVDSEIMALHDDLSERLSRELSDVDDDLVDELEGRLNEKLDNHREALEEARRKREQKDEEVRQEQSRLEERIRTLREIRAEIA